MKWFDFLNLIDHSDLEIFRIAQAIKRMHPFQNFQHNFFDFGHEDGFKIHFIFK